MDSSLLGDSLNRSEVVRIAYNNVNKRLLIIVPHKIACDVEESFNLFQGLSIQARTYGKIILPFGFVSRCGDYDLLTSVVPIHALMFAAMSISDKSVLEMSEIVYILQKFVEELVEGKGGDHYDLLGCKVWVTDVKPSRDIMKFLKSTTLRVRSLFVEHKAVVKRPCTKASEVLVESVDENPSTKNMPFDKDEFAGHLAKIQAIRSTGAGKSYMQGSATGIREVCYLLRIYFIVYCIERYWFFLCYPCLCFI